MFSSKPRIVVGTAVAPSNLLHPRGRAAIRTGACCLVVTRCESCGQEIPAPTAPRYTHADSTAHGRSVHAPILWRLR